MAVQWLVLTIAWMGLGSLASFDGSGLATLEDRPMVAAADPAAVGLVGRAHGCVPVAVWRNTHGAGVVPDWVLMTSATRAVVVETPAAFAMARAGWVTKGWCTR